MPHPFRQIDVFGRSVLAGNPVAVVLDAEDVTTEEMRRFSVWTNLSEATFVLPPTVRGADYRVRIFSLEHELPFAGHPTLGTARAWLDAGGVPATPGTVVQECLAGLIPVRVDGDVLSFAAPPRMRTGQVDPAQLSEVLDVLGIDPDALVAAERLDNGPGWIGVLLGDDAAVRAVKPDAAAPKGPWSLGVIGPTEPGDDVRFEVRAFFTGADGAIREDPVTGSLNAAAAQWLLETGRATAPYTARQGTVLGRDGRIHISADEEGVWVGGRTDVAVTGTVDLD
jgi:PhzF family phenazine biosynthesis protein